MRFPITPNKFKGSLTALAAAEAMGVFAFAGAVADDPRCGELPERTLAITPEGMPLGATMPNAASLLEESVGQAARCFPAFTA